MFVCILLASVTIPLAVYAAVDTDSSAIEPDISLISASPVADHILLASDFVPPECTLSSANAVYASSIEDSNESESSSYALPADGSTDTDTNVESTSDPDTFAVTVSFGDRESITCTTSVATLREILASAEYEILASDRFSIDLDTTIDGEYTVYVDTVVYEEISEVESIPFETITEEVQTIPRGTTQTVTEGVYGSKTVVYTVEYVNGSEVSRAKQYDYITEYPVDQVNLYGTGGVFYSSDGTAYSYSYKTTVRATYYSLSGNTASGMPVGDNVIATDPSVFPLGTRMYIENGYMDMGVKVAADTGGAVYGNLIDIWMDASSPYYSQFASQGVCEMTAYILD